MPSPAPPTPSLAPDPGTHRHAARQHSPLAAAYTITGGGAARPPGGTSALARQGDLMPPSTDGPARAPLWGVRGSGEGDAPLRPLVFSSFVVLRSTPLASPRSQCLRLLRHDSAAQGISAFSTGLTGWLWPPRVGGVGDAQTAFGSLAAQALSGAAVTTRW